MFTPKNINKRVEDLKIIQAKELQDYKEFVKEFSNNLSLIQGKTSDDEKEQLFIDLIQECEIKTDQQKYHFGILLVSGVTNVIFKYDWKNNILYCSNDRVWSVFAFKFKMPYEAWQCFITDQVETHFKFRHSTIINDYLMCYSKIEAYFNFKDYIINDYYINKNNNIEIHFNFRPFINNII